MAQGRPPASATYAMHSGPSAAVPQQHAQLQAFNSDEISKLIARSDAPRDLQQPSARAYAPPLPPRPIRAGAMGDGRRLRARRRARRLGHHIEDQVALNRAPALSPSNQPSRRICQRQEASARSKHRDCKKRDAERLGDFGLHDRTLRRQAKRPATDAPCWII